MVESEVLKLRKELLHARETIEDLQEELRLTDEKCLQLQEEYGRNQELVQQAREDLAKIDGIVEQKVAERMDQEIKDKENLEELLREKNELIDRLKDEQEKLINRERMIMRDYDYLKGKMDETMGGNFEMQDALREVKRANEERERKEKEIEQLVAQLNELSKQTEDLIAENRVLREMAGTPENFGIPISEIKLAEKEKLEEYKVKLRHYEEEIHTLEKERAILKARLRERPTIPGKEEFTKGLTGDQIMMVEQFIADLREGRDFQMGEAGSMRRENERLKAELFKLQKSSTNDLEAIVERAVMKRSQGRFQGAGEGVLEKIQKENADLLKNIKDMMRTGPIRMGDTEIVESAYKRRPRTEDEAAKTEVIQKHLSRYIYPPEPIKKADGSIVDGKSYRFIGEPIPVVPFDLTRYNADKINKEEFAFLQLALIEAIELNSRKDKELKCYTNDAHKTEEQVRSYILQRNELYKEYSKTAAQWKEDEKSFKEQNAELTDLLRAEKIKNSDLEKLLSTLQRGMKESDFKEKIIDLTKKSSILEVSMMQLTRKYLTLQEEYKLIHTQYMNVEKDNKDRELQLEERIMRLKEWKSKAVLELKYLYNKLRSSVSLVRYERQKRELDALKEKEMQWMEATQELMLLKSDRVGTERARAECEEALQETKAMLADAEQELQLVNGRLKRKDSQYAYERAILERVIDSFRMYRMSPQEAFEIFDKNRSGSISREEFRSILNQLRLDLSTSELEAVMRFLDIDSSGSIRYKSFIRTLKRYGIKSRSKEEEIIARAAEIIGRTGVNLQKTFEVIDRDGDSLINKQEMLDALISMRLGIKEEDLSNVLNYIYPEGATGIDYRRFCRVFEKSLQSQDERKEKEGWKIDILRKIDEKLMDQKISLHSAFVTNKEGEVTKDEFARVCIKLGVLLSPQELNELYTDFDTKGTGSVAFADIAVGIISAKAAKGGKHESGYAKEVEHDMRTFAEEGDKETLRTKVMILQEREKVALEKARRENEQVRLLQDLVKKRTEECEKLEKHFRQLTDKHFKLQETSSANEAKLANCISKKESLELKQKYETIERELLDKEAAMQTYKTMYEAVVQQMRSLELSFGRKRDEVAELHKALLEIQSNNDKDNLIGKLYYVVLLSRWQEGATNRKYDALITDMKRVKAALYSTETEVAKKEEEISHLETRLQDTTELLSQLNEKVKEKESAQFMQEKVRELTGKMKDLIQSKIDTELANIKLREENTKLAYLTDQLEMEKKQAQELAEVLRYKNDSEIARKFAEVSDKLATLRLSELRAQRDAKMSKEKETYLERVNAQSLTQIKKLEEELGTAITNLQRAEEAYREKDKERERLFFELKQAKRMERSLEPVKEDLVIEAKGTIHDTKKTDSILSHGTNNSELIGLLKEKDEMIVRLKSELSRTRGSANVQITADQRRMDLEYIKDEEKRQMADVAYKTIKTLETIINNQKEQLKRKDDFIKQTRDESVKEREESLREITRLQKELAGETQRAMGKIIALGKDNAPKGGFSEIGIRGMGEMETALTIKDGKIRELAAKADMHSKEIKKREDEIREWRNKNTELEEKLAKFNREEKLSLTRQELEKTKKELAKRNAEYKGLKTTIEKLKQDFDTYTDKNVKQAADINAYASREKQYDHQKAVVEQQLRQAQKELQQQTKVLNRVQEKIMKMKGKKRELKSEVEMLKKELASEKTLRNNVQKELEGEKAKVSAPAIVKEPEKKEEKPATFETEALKQEIDKLKQQIVEYKFKAIPQGDETLKVNIDKGIVESKTIHKISGVQYIDEISDQAAINVSAKVSPLEVFEAYSEGEEWIAEAKFADVCSKVGIQFDERATSVLLSKLRKNGDAGKVEYKEFAHTIKGNLFKRFVDNEALQLGKIAVEQNLTHTELMKGFMEEKSAVSKKDIEKGMAKLFKLDSESKIVEYILKRTKSNEKEEQYDAMKLVQLVEKAAKTHLVETVREAIKESKAGAAFVELDADHDRCLEKMEFAKLLDSFGLKIVGSNLNRLCEVFDPKRSGNIAFDSYCNTLLVDPQPCTFSS